MKQNPSIDILSSNLLVLNESYGLNSMVSGKVVSFPTLDQLIKFNMLFNCCIAKTSLLVRVSSVGDRLGFETHDPDSLAFEDYELWLRLIHEDNPPQFANIGSILTHVRKQSARPGAASIEAEVPLKVKFLTRTVITGNLRD